MMTTMVDKGGIGRQGGESGGDECARWQERYRVEALFCPTRLR